MKNITGIDPMRARDEVEEQLAKIRDILEDTYEWGYDHGYDYGYATGLRDGVFNADKQTLGKVKKDWEMINTQMKKILGEKDGQS